MTSTCSLRDLDCWLYWSDQLSLTMLARNPTRMDYQQKYEEIVAEYNREKDRVTNEETFRRLTELVDGLDVEQKRAVEEGLSENELALFDLLKKEDLGKAEVEVFILGKIHNKLPSPPFTAEEEKAVAGKTTPLYGSRQSKASLRWRLED